jgi:putative transposase
MFANRPRLHASCYRGEQRYFLTFCTDKRSRAFAARSTVELAWREILHSADRRAFEAIAYVFMPDHVHLLVSGRDAASDLRAFVHLAKQRTAFEYARTSGLKLWQPSYWDRVLRDEESTWAVIRYMCDNPARARLVRTAREYEFLGSQVMTRDELLRELERQPAGSWQPKGHTTWQP